MVLKTVVIKQLKFVYYDLSIFVFKNLPRLFDNYAVARTEQDALVKSTTKIFFRFCGLLRKPKLEKATQICKKKLTLQINFRSKLEILSNFSGFLRIYEIYHQKRFFPKCIYVQRSAIAIETLICQSI
jgi:hypothetical protein